MNTFTKLFCAVLVVFSSFVNASVNDEIKAALIAEGINLVSPVKEEKPIKTSNFGWRIHPTTNKRKFHTGADLRGRMGAPIYAVADGKIVFQGKCGGPAGQCVIVDHGRIGKRYVQTVYMHVSKHGIAPYGEVKAGTKIAESGDTGIGTGAHLHIEVRVYNTPRKAGVRRQLASYLDFCQISDMCVDLEMVAQN